MLQDSILMLDGSDADNLAIVGGTSFPITTSVGELFFRTDEDKLYIRNAADDGWVDLAGAGGGGSSTDTTSRRLQTDATNDAFTEEYQFRAVNQYAGYTTIKTIAVTGTGAGSFTSGLVSAQLTGLTNSVGVGSRTVLWYWKIEAGVFNIGSISDSPSNAAAPQFQLAVSGTNILIQVRGSGGAQTMTGAIKLTLNMPAVPAGGTFAIT